MIDMTPTIQAKSDQLNADDLISGPITIKITQVSVGNAEDQPINIRYEGDNGRPWKPCKSMRRVLVGVWGKDGAQYVGRYLTLFRDASVKWAGVEVGGIRISHMSHLNKQESISLMVTRGSKKPYSVKPLQIQQEAEKNEGFLISDNDYMSWTNRMDEAQSVDDLKKIGSEIGGFTDKYDSESIGKLKAYYKDRLNSLKNTPPPDEIFPGDIPQGMSAEEYYESTRG